VRDGDLVAVLHPHPDVAEMALSKIRAEFEPAASTLDDKTIYQHLLAVAPQGDTVGQSGDLAEGRRLARRTFDQTYLDSYMAHAPIETHTALAMVEQGRVTVWASTQRPFGIKDEVAQTLGIPSQNVRVITPFVGGGFGGKTANRQAVEAARLAKLAGKPCRWRGAGRRNSSTIHFALPQS